MIGWVEERDNGDDHDHDNDNRDGDGAGSGDGDDEGYEECGRYPIMLLAVFE